MSTNDEGVTSAVAPYCCQPSNSPSYQQYTSFDAHRLHQEYSALIVSGITASLLNVMAAPFTPRIMKIESVLNPHAFPFTPRTAPLVSSTETLFLSATEEPSVPSMKAGLKLDLLASSFTPAVAQIYISDINSMEESVDASQPQLHKWSLPPLDSPSMIAWHSSIVSPQSTVSIAQSSPCETYSSTAGRRQFRDTPFLTPAARSAVNAKPKKMLNEYISTNTQPQEETLVTQLLLPIFTSSNRRSKKRCLNHGKIYMTINYDTSTFANML